MLSLMAELDACYNNMMGMHCRCVGQNVKNAPVEDEGDHEEVNKKAAQRMLH
jgi:hypothetical protein